MLLVAAVRSANKAANAHSEQDFASRLKTVRSQIPAVTHVDGSARIQTVAADENPRFHRLLKAFEKLTGCAVLINTSFNVRGEPPVCTPEDAFRCFLATEIDYLVLGNALLDKREQHARAAVPAKPVSGFRHEYEHLDRSPRAMRRFAFAVGLVLLTVGGLLFFRQAVLGGTVVAAAIALLLSGVIAPGSLGPVHRAWMTLALGLGWVMTRVILTIVFFGPVTVVGLLQRLFGAPVLEVAFRDGSTTYWTERKSKSDRAQYEQQF